MENKESLSNPNQKLEPIAETSPTEIKAEVESSDPSGNLMSNSLRVFQKMGALLSAKLSSLQSNLSATLKKFYLAKIQPWVVKTVLPRLILLKRQVNEMIGAAEKGIEAARLTAPPQGSYEGVDLRVLPKYICFRAALLQSKLTLQYVILILSAVLLSYLAVSRSEIHALHKKLREKEYILAPGVSDFTVASPQGVPDRYVSDAVNDFLSQLGNVTAGNIDEQYASLSESMSPQFKVKFSAEASDWKSQVKTENISELLTVTQKEILTDGNGKYKVTALGRRDTYIANEYVGHKDEVIEMQLALVPPTSGKRWFLQITNLQRQRAETFEKKRGVN